MNRQIPFAKPDCGEEEIQEIAKVIQSGWLTTGSRTLQFEKEFSEFIGSKYSLAVNSCTAALHLALEAVGVEAGHKVLVPVHTFTASVEVVRYLQADPVFIDVDPGHFCITAENIEKGAYNAGVNLKDHCVSTLIPVHLGGHPCDMESIMELSRIHNLKVVEDAAHSFPAYAQFSSEKTIDSAESNGSMIKKIIGTIGDATCFSFYANKTITTGEGGMICTDNDEIANRIKVMRLHGINRDVWDRFSEVQSDWAYDVIAPGFKYNMPDIASAIGIHQLRKANLFLEKRRRIAERYLFELRGLPGLTLPKISCPHENHSWHLFIILIEASETKNNINRDTFIHKMKEKGIGTSVHYIPLHRMTYYKKQYGLRPEMFPNSEWIFQRCISLPIYSSMTDEDVRYVIESIQEIMDS